MMAKLSLRKIPWIHQSTVCMLQMIILLTKRETHYRSKVVVKNHSTYIHAISY